MGSVAHVTDVDVRSRPKRSKSATSGKHGANPKGDRMSLFPFRRLLVGALGAALASGVLVALPVPALPHPLPSPLGPRSMSKA
jgi:hypothetical protein